LIAIADERACISTDLDEILAVGNLEMVPKFQRRNHVESLNGSLIGVTGPPALKDGNATASGYPYHPSRLFTKPQIAAAADSIVTTSTVARLVLRRALASSTLEASISKYFDEAMSLTAAHQRLLCP
jgi:hypothetical protein